MTRGAALAISLVACLSACGRSPSGSTPAEGTIAAGQTEREQLRIAALAPAIAVMLQDLGLEDRIVAKHTWDLALADSIPAVGDQFELDYEALLALDPTHVYTQYETAGVPARLTELAAERGWHLEDYRLNSLADIAGALDDLHLDLVGEFMTDRELDVGDIPVGGASIPDFADSMPSDRLAAAWSDRGPAVDGAGRVLLLAQGDGAAALGPGSYHHEILERIGGTPALTNGGPWMELDAEDVLLLAPDAIVLFAPRIEGPDDRWPRPEPEWTELAERLGAIAGLPIPAVEHRRVVLIDHPYALLPSPALADVADAMAAALRVWDESP